MLFPFFFFFLFWKGGAINKFNKKLFTENIGSTCTNALACKKCEEFIIF